MNGSEDLPHHSLSLHLMNETYMLLVLSVLTQERTPILWSLVGLRTSKLMIVIKTRNL